jgi:hypothetical protein
LVAARADPAFEDEFVYAQREVLRRLMPTLNTFHVPELEGRLLGRPEGKHDDWCAFPQFITADFASRGPFPERNQLYLVYIFNYLTIGLLSGAFYVVYGFLRLEWEPGPRVGPRRYPYQNTSREPGVQSLL